MLNFAFGKLSLKNFFTFQPLPPHHQIIHMAPSKAETIRAEVARKQKEMEEMLRLVEIKEAEEKRKAEEEASRKRYEEAAREAKE